MSKGGKRSSLDNLNRALGQKMINCIHATAVEVIVLVSTMQPTLYEYYYYNDYE